MTEAYTICPYCGENIAPGEICDCDKHEPKENEYEED